MKKLEDEVISKIFAKLREAVSESDRQELSQMIIANQKLPMLPFLKTISETITDPEDIFPLELKLNIFETMSYVLLSKARYRFIKHFVTRIYYFLGKYSKVISQFAELSKRVITHFTTWEKHNVFSTPFLKKLRAKANFIFYFHQEKSKPFQKYSKNFLQCYKDVRAFDVTKFLSDLKTMQKQEIKEASSIKDDFAALEGEEEEGDEERKEKADILLRKVESSIESLGNILLLHKEGNDYLGQIIQKELAFGRAEKEQ